MMIIDNDLHIHSKLSLCSNDPLQTTNRILQYAEENKLNTICITDHFWDERVQCACDWYKPQNFEHLSAAKPLPQSDEVRFLFGCETEMDMNMRLGISKERFDDFDFVVIPINHFHMINVTIPSDIITPAQKADFWLKKFNTVLNMDLPFKKIGMAHLACGLMDSSRSGVLEIIKSIDQTKMERTFIKAAQLGVGIELNASDMNYAPEEKDIILRPFAAAKKAGCKFYFGSDAHHPDELDRARQLFEKAVFDLELEERDKFIIGNF